MPLFLQTYSRNRTTSPASLAALANVNPPPGNYEVTMTCYFSGTAPVDGVDSDNVFLVVDNTFTTVQWPLPAVAGIVQIYRALVSTNGTNVKLSAVGAGTVGCIYNTSISAVPLKSAGEDPAT